MRTRRWIFVTVFLGAISIVVVLWLLPGLQVYFSPRPRAAWLGIEADDTGIAKVGTVRITSGTGFRLHAILEAESAGGDPVYYTEARRVEIEGRTIPERLLRPWDQARPVRLLWFTVEGIAPYLELKSEGDLARFRFQEFFHPEWGSNWSIAGELDSHFDRQLDIPSWVEDRTFGTQRYQVRIEIYDTESGLVPTERFKSVGAKHLPERAAAFPTVVATTPGAAGSASQVFGLTQIEPPQEATMAVLEEVSALAGKRLAFSRLTLLRDQIRAAGREPDDLKWTRLALSAGVAWGEVVREGDLLRVGSRVVVLWRDAGERGKLDPGDLCFDVEKGASIRPLGEIFTGLGDVEWARLGAALP